MLLQLDGDMHKAEAVLDDLSNLPQMGKGFLVANVRNPRPGTHEGLRPDERDWRIAVLKGEAY